MTPDQRKARLRAMQPWYSLGLMCVMVSVLIGLIGRGRLGGLEPLRDGGAGFLAGLGIVFLTYALVRLRRLRTGQTAGGC